MLNIKTTLGQYMAYCEYQKNLSADTLKAYRIDLRQFQVFLDLHNAELCRETISDYISALHQSYAPRTIKRKAASIKAFCLWLEYEGTIERSPFDRLRLKFNVPSTLPRTIPLDVVESILSSAYQCQRRTTSSSGLRDIAILELLFSTGLRVSELCHLKPECVDFNNGTMLILGKGAKERLLQIGNPEVLTSLKRYSSSICDSIRSSGWLFVNRLGQRYSEQSVRSMIRKYLALSGSALHITPHMFRHTFATQLLEEDVDIRYIQAFLGHSSIATTQIYTHVTTKKQMTILATKHPRNTMHLNYG